MWLDSHQWELSPGSHGQLSHTLEADFGKVKAVFSLTPHKLLTLPQCFALFLLTIIAVSSWVDKEKNSDTQLSVPIFLKLDSPFQSEPQVHACTGLFPSRNTLS